MVNLAPGTNVSSYAVWGKCLEISFFGDQAEAASGELRPQLSTNIYVPLAHHGRSARRLACVSTLEWVTRYSAAGRVTRRQRT